MTATHQTATDLADAGMTPSPSRTENIRIE
jgi:hypothetical protein